MILRLLTALQLNAHPDIGYLERAQRSQSDQKNCIGYRAGRKNAVPEDGKYRNRICSPKRRADKREQAPFMIQLQYNRSISASVTPSQNGSILVCSPQSKLFNRITDCLQVFGLLHLHRFPVPCNLFFGYFSG